MDLIKELENMFRKIETKLDSNELIGNKYSKDLKKIKLKFVLKEANYKNGLNKRHDEMLKELITKRDQELNHVNAHPQENRAQLKALYESIKSQHLVFAKGLASVDESSYRYFYTYNFVQCVRCKKWRKLNLLSILDRILYRSLNTPDKVISDYKELVEIGIYCNHPFVNIKK